MRHFDALMLLYDALNSIIPKAYALVFLFQCQYDDKLFLAALTEAERGPHFNKQADGNIEKTYEEHLI